MGNVEENTYKTKMSDQQDIFNIRRQMSSADHEVMTVSRNIVTVNTIIMNDISHHKAQSDTYLPT